MLVVGLGSTASASDWVHAVEADNAEVHGYLDFSIHAYGQEDWTATGTVAWS